MKLGLLITARLGSSRLPEKHLILANQKPLLYWLIKRFEQEFTSEIKQHTVHLIIATSVKPGNQALSKAVIDTSCGVFAGSDDNIPLRHLQCAEKYNLSHIISIDGDDILCSTHAARMIYDQMKNDPIHNYFSITGLPLGMNLSGYLVSYLKECLGKQTGKKLETGWGRVFIAPRTWTFALANYNVMGDLRFTLDYKEDAVFFCEIINRLKEKIINLSDEELINFVNKNKLYEINSSLKEIYWNNYNLEKQKEINEQQ